MKLTILGHAGLLVETENKVIVCDPWMSLEGAFLGSWHQWPRNDKLGEEVMEKIMNADYIYVSHMHRDHFDELFLKKFFAKNLSTPVLLPGYADEVQRRALGYMGAKEFILLPNEQEIHVDHFKVTCVIDDDGTYAGRGDSALFIADSTACVMNQNDAKIDWYPENIDVHLTQFSGAIWYPMTYRKGMNNEQKYLALIPHEIERRQKAFMNTISASGAKHVVPFAGPPVFLREELRWLNNIGESVFYDQPEIASYVKAHGFNGLIMNMPGTVIDYSNDVVTVIHPHGMSDKDVEDYYSPEYKEQEIDQLAQDRAGVIKEIDKSFPEPSDDVVERLKEWLNPIVAKKGDIFKNIGFNILLATDDGIKVIFDWKTHEVRDFIEGEHYGHSITLPRRLLEYAVEKKEKVWTSELFLSCMFEAWREGAYNRYVYDLFAFLA